MQTFSISIAVNVPHGAPYRSIYEAIRQSHPENFRAFIASLLNAAGLNSRDIRDGTVEVGYMPSDSEAWEDKATQWMIDQVESQSLTIEALCRRAVRWGMRAPSDVLGEIYERMGDEAPEDRDEPLPTKLPVITPPIPPAPNGPKGESSVEHSIPDRRMLFLAVFLGVIGAHPGGENTRYRALWPTAGALNRESFIEARDSAIETAMNLLGTGFCTHEDAGCWLDDAGWVIPPA